MGGVVIKKETHRDYIDKYLEKVFSLCDKVRLFSSSSYSSEAPMHNLYVSMPTNLYVDVEVKNSKLIKIWERFIYDKDFDKYSLKENEYIEYDNNKKQKLVSKLEELINQGQEYLYPNISERPLIISPPWKDGIKENYWILSASDLISLYDQVVLLGGPGSGKSTTLRYLTVELINNYFGEGGNEFESNLSTYLLDNKYIPIYIEMRDFSKWLNENERENVNLLEIKEYISKFINIEKNEEAKEALWSCIKDNNVLFIFDGLDELYTENRKYSVTKEKLNGIIRQIKGELKCVKLLLSSRIGEYIDYELPQFKKVKLMPMDRHKIAELIYKTYNYNSEVITNDQINNFIGEMNEKNLKEDIIGNPLLLSLVVAIAMKKPGGKNKLPNEKSQILYEGIKLLIERWYSNEAMPSFFETYSSDEILQKLKFFAYNSNENGLISFKDLFNFLKADKDNSNDILDYLVRRAGLIIQKGEEYEFAHKSFRSYLAASYIIESENCLRYLTTDNRNNFMKQHETTSLAIDILFDRIKEVRGNDNSVAILWNIITLLIDEGETEWDIWLAGKILSNRRYLLLDAKVRFQDEIIKSLRENLLKVFERSGKYAQQDLDMSKRLECGIVLGEIGDIRSGVGIVEGKPKLEWCDIPEGRFSYGIEKESIDKIENTSWGKSCIFSRELPMHKVYVQHFQISKYPITVLQFKTFLEDEQGYYSEKWYAWSDVAKEFFERHVKSNKFIFTEAHDVNNYPMTYVSFIEAVAFCKWLSLKCDEDIRLPSEIEWEYAAKLQNGIFAWGDEYYNDQCNGLSTNIGKVCPVGSFYLPKGNFPVDMCGNVWEWTQSYYTEDHEYDGVNTIIDVEENNSIRNEYLITDRGGSFLNGPNCMRMSFRGRDPVDARADRHGFRVIRSVEKFKGKREKKPYLRQEGMNDASKICERKGYGPIVKRNDSIVIWYELFNVTKNQYIERGMTYKFILGSGKIHQLLEDMLIGKRVASFFTVNLQAEECFGNKIFGDLSLTDVLRFEISIMDVVE